jgi:hypothetical protein
MTEDDYRLFSRWYWPSLLFAFAIFVLVAIFSVT